MNFISLLSIKCGLIWLVGYFSGVGRFDSRSRKPVRVWNHSPPLRVDEQGGSTQGLGGRSRITRTLRTSLHAREGLVPQHLRLHIVTFRLSYFCPSFFSFFFVSDSERTGLVPSRCYVLKKKSSSFLRKQRNVVASAPITSFCWSFRAKFGKLCRYVVVGVQCLTIIAP